MAWLTLQTTSPNFYSFTYQHFTHPTTERMAHVITDTMVLTAQSTGPSDSSLCGPVTRSAASDKSKNRVMTPARKEQNRIAQKLFRQRKSKQSQATQSKARCRGGSNVPADLRPRPAESNATASSIDNWYLSDHLQRPAIHPTGGLHETFERDTPGTVGTVAANANSASEVSTAVPWLSLITDISPDFSFGPTSVSSQRIPPRESIYPLGNDESSTGLTFERDLLEAVSCPFTASDDAAEILQKDSTATSTYDALFPTNSPVIQFDAPVPRHLSLPSTSGMTQPVPTMIFSAVLHNALTLGFNLNRLATACSPDTYYMSPFYRPDATPQDDPNLLILSVQCSATPASQHIPENLRPTLAQLLIPHHASLDLIPLPRFRDRAITLSAALPQFFSLRELKMDIYAHGALVLSGCSSECQPWDWRSWKAAPWFLRKWSMAVDSQDEIRVSSI
ncbi:hypothetical protein BJ170DRAFT_617656 [Xylariales sp. AK1849]|nr:hypothetical protein BJ170DRAFT_617656 [Xylariales sp. AK1849]